MTLGLAFICGDETEQLRTMLDSVAVCKFDCISAVLTKESPATEAILKEYGCIITKVDPWLSDYSNWDFTKARQLSYDACDADWILYLDTDDTLTGADRLREALEDWKAMDCVHLQYAYEDGNIYYKERVIRKDSYKWVGIVHECLMPTRNINWHTSDKCIVQHHQIPNDRGNRNLKLIEREYETAKTPRTVLYCGKDSQALGLSDKAIKYFLEYLDMDDNDANKQDACIRLYDISKKEKYLLRAIELLPEFALPYFKLAQFHLEAGDYDKAIKFVALGWKRKRESPYGLPSVSAQFTTYPLWILDNAFFKKEIA